MNRKKPGRTVLSILMFTCLLLPAAIDSDPEPVLKVQATPLGPWVDDLLTVLIRVDLEFGWYLYWQNPGDSGLAPALHWDLPAGFQAGSLEHQVPEKFVYEGLVSFGHSGVVFFLTAIRRAPESKTDYPVVLQGILDWTACRESCRFGQSQIQLNIPADPPATGAAPANFPQPFDISGLRVTAVEAAKVDKGLLVLVELSGPRLDSVKDFFPFKLDGFTLNHAAIKLSNGRIEIPLTASQSGAENSRPQRIAGVLLVNGAGYLLDVAVPVMFR